MIPTYKQSVQNNAYITATSFICLQVSVANKSYKSDNYNQQQLAHFYSFRHAVVIIGHLEKPPSTAAITRQHTTWAPDRIAYPEPGYF